MPIAFDPEQRAEFVLSSDKDRPEGQRITWIAKFLTVRQAMRVRELTRRVSEAKTDDEISAAIREGLGVGIVGWRGARGEDGKELPFSIDAIDDVLTTHEKWLLLVEYPGAVMNVEFELKKASASQPPSGGEPSAKTADPATATS